MNSKIRRHSGRYTPRMVDPSMKWSDIQRDALEPAEEYDDWIEYRDGMRDWIYLEWKKKDKLKRKKKSKGRRRK